MYIKKLFILIILILNFSLSISVVLATPHSLSTPEACVKEFLCIKMNTLVTKNVDTIDDYYSSKYPNAQKYLLFTKQELLQDYIIAYASNDYDIKKVIPQVKIISTKVNNDVALVEAHLKTNIYWNASNALGKPIVGTKSEKHSFTLCKEDDRWIILIDQYMTSRGHSSGLDKQDLNRLSDTIERLKKEAKASIDKSKKSKSTRLTLEYSKQKTISSKTNLSHNGIEHRKRLTASTIYNREGAYNWAYTYWDNYSTAFVNLGDEKWEGGDCTNFVSQCLRAGGANNSENGTYQWYYKSSGTSDTKNDSYSWTWSTARGLNYILHGNYKSREFGPKATEMVINGDSEYNSVIGQYVEIGDIIQYQWKSNMNITHSAIIVGILFNSSKERYEPVIAEHTNDSWSTPWTNNAYKTYFVHIEGVN